MMDRRAMLAGAAALASAGPVSAARAAAPPVACGSRILDAHAMRVEAIPATGASPVVRDATFYRAPGGDVSAPSASFKAAVSTNQKSRETRS